jgi:protein TonB
MSPPAAGLAVLLHVAVAALLLWSPVHKPTDDPETPIEVTMEQPPPPPEPKPAPKPESKPEPKPAPPKAQPPQPAQLPGLVAPGAIGPKDTAPPMERGETTRTLPGENADKSPEKPEPPQQALAKPAEPAPPPPPPPPQPTLEKELPPIEAAPAPLTSRDIAALAPPTPQHKAEPPKQPSPAPAAPRPVPPQLAPSPLSNPALNKPAPRKGEQPRSTFVNPADTYAQNTLSTAYLQGVVARVMNYRADILGANPRDFAVVRFTIARNGKLLGITILNSTGNESLNQNVISAFQSVQPFQPLPADLPGDAVSFTLTLSPRPVR